MTVRVQFTARLIKALRRVQKVDLRLSITGPDNAGNARRLTRTVSLTRR